MRLKHGNGASKPSHTPPTLALANLPKGLVGVTLPVTAAAGAVGALPSLAAFLAARSAFSVAFAYSSACSRSRYSIVLSLDGQIAMHAGVTSPSTVTSQRWHVPCV